MLLRLVDALATHPLMWELRAFVLQLFALQDEGSDDLLGVSVDYENLCYRMGDHLSLLIDAGEYEEAQKVDTAMLAVSRLLRDMKVAKSLRMTRSLEKALGFRAEQPMN